MNDFSRTLAASWSGGPNPISIRISEIQTGIEVKFAQSQISLGLKRYKSSRILRRTDSASWESTRASVMKSIWKLHGCEIISIPRGEDPRLFEFRGDPWMMVQVFEEAKLDVDVRIVNLRTKLSYSLKSPMGFNGKNWVPFNVGGNLYFAYSLDPLVLLEATFETGGIDLKLKKSAAGFKPFWGLDVVNSIGVIRGGSPGLVDNNKVFGFSHAINLNGDVHAHRLGFYSIDLESQSLTHKYLTNYTPGFLFDSYGLELFEGKITVQGTLAIGDIHLQTSKISRVEVEWDFAELKRWLFTS